MMEVVVTTGAIRCAKLQSNHHHQQTNTHLFFTRIDALPDANSVTALKEKVSNSMDLLTQAHLQVFQCCL